MRYYFKEMPGEAGLPPRPVVPVVVEGMSHSPFFCLVDSGSRHNRFGGWVAGVCGIDLGGAPEELIGIGGIRTTARTVTVQLSAAGLAWEAPVSFCEPWPLAFQVLGQEGFFRWFDVRIRAAEFTVDVETEDR